MANKSVEIGGGMQSVGRATSASPATDETDVGHLRPLSEAVLKASGLHGGLDSKGHVRDLRGLNDGALDVDPAKLDMGELHVQLLQLQEDEGGMISRDVNADGSVVLRMVYGDGDVVSGKGADTRAAAAQLIAKAGGIQ